MAKIVQLMGNIDNEYEYPRTLTKAVIDENGNSVDKILDKKFTDQDNKIQKVIEKQKVISETEYERLLENNLLEDDVFYNVYEDE